MNKDLAKVTGLRFEMISKGYSTKQEGQKVPYSANTSKRPSGTSISKSDLKINSRKSKTETNSSRNDFPSIHEENYTSNEIETEKIPEVLVTPEVDDQLETRLQSLEYQPSLKSFQNPEFPVSMKSEELAVRGLKIISPQTEGSANDNLSLSRILGLQSSESESDFSRKDSHISLFAQDDEERSIENKISHLSDKEGYNINLLLRTGMVSESPTPNDNCIPSHFQTYDKIAKIQKKVEEIQSQLTETEYIEILNELDPSPFNFISKDERVPFFELIKKYANTDLEPDTLDKTDQNFVHPLIKEKKKRVKKKKHSLSKSTINKPSEEPDTLEDAMSKIERIYKERQMKLLNKYDAYFQTENALKSELKQIELKRKNIMQALESCECYGKIVITRVPIITNDYDELMDTFESIGHVLFEQEYTFILDQFIERKIRFFPMFSMIYNYSFDKTFVINIYEDIEQKKLYRSYKLANLDFIQTGMTVNSMGDQFELLKMVTLNEENKQREIYVIGFIQYQLEKWMKVLSIQDKIVFYDKAFEHINDLKIEEFKMNNIERSDSQAIRLNDSTVKPPVHPSTFSFKESYQNKMNTIQDDSDYFSPETRTKMAELMKIREQVEHDDSFFENSYLNRTLKSSQNLHSSMDAKEDSGENSPKNMSFTSAHRNPHYSGGTFGKKE
ncbi:unnamed protein product [Moneuplotes crassus]|uniref:Uncharacterized protein n=1 Tax=Euplotes crassus TaxID=5936 RepID=A0AAD1YA80_EUPCR|nr:unnamed protein product [Moneuplotes crassus]